ncbi:hypothetical protein H2O64_21925 [Kordia sp. YSTF-M3]|uniref:Uncharacterized protein n=1 Tax=Kordia aestuariivivens TaxID=2759037 RepID=A0ABR7QG06_9FLAO|nr:hypothetical protein [Kordia aestuariivivens]MBC8757343.1 hypothetical protein [Kordia aestuariivivens]
MIQFKILWKWVVIFSLGFVVCTIVGTQTHELGHAAVAQSLGYETELYYGSMTYYHKGYFEDADVKKLDAFYDRNGSFKNFTEADKKHADQLQAIIDEKFPYNETHSFLVTLGGPLQTILTSFLGLFILTYRKSKKRREFKRYDWIAIFLSLFVLREVFNTFMATVSYFINGTNNFHGDEFRISSYLDVHQWSIPILTGVFGTIIAVYVIFKIIPLKYRFTFIISGFLGSISGFILWFNYLGPWLFSQ